MEIIIIVVIIIVVVILCISSSIGAYFYFKSPECDGATCSNLVTLSNWSLASETDTSANLTRTCTKKPDTKTDGCEKISSSILSKSVRWTDTSCNKICGSDGVGSKSVFVDGVLIRSRNTNYSCNRIDCETMVNLTDWTKASETTTSVNLSRTCSNKNSNADACMYFDITENVNWDGTTKCYPRTSGSPVNNKILTYDEQNFISNNQYSCSPITCPQSRTTLCNSDSFIPFNGNYVEHSTMMGNGVVSGNASNATYVIGNTNDTLALKTNNPTNVSEANRFSLIYSFGGYNPNTTGLTLSVWLNYQRITGREIITLRNSNEVKYRIAINLREIDRFKVEIITDNDGTYINLNNPPAANTWFHIAYTIGKDSSNNNILTAYIDGNKIEQKVITAELKTYNRLYLLRSAFDENQLDYSYPGLIKNLRIYKRALSDTEIRTLYDNKM